MSRSKHLDPAVRYAASLEWQEAQRWTEYLQRNTREALKAWRDVRRRLSLQRGLLA